jgi:2-dehydro-3-deoxygluconokinase
MIVCFGELLLRLTAPARELLLQTPRLDVHAGGAEANVAVGLACLGHQTRVVSRVPANALGEAAVGYLRRYGVALAGPGDFDWERLLDGADLLHLSGITPALGPRSAALAVAAAEAAEAKGVAISFDGNYRAQLWQRWDSDPRSILTELVSRSEILFGNHRDVSLLLGRDFGGDGEGRRRDAAEAAFAAFPKLKLIASTARHVEDADTHRISARIDGRDGSAQTEEVTVAGIVDRIGAGDAFAAGILHGLRTGRDLDWTVRAGLALTALKHSLPGDASLFAPRDIEAFMAGELDVRR